MIKLSELMRDTLSHLLGEQKPITGLLLRKRGYKDLEATPISTEYEEVCISIPPSHALLILPQRIEKMPTTLEEIVGLSKMFTTFLPVKRDVFLAGLAYMLFNPHFLTKDVCKRRQIGIITYLECMRPDISPFYTKTTLIEFTDGSSFVVEGNPYKGFLDKGFYEPVKQRALELLNSTYVANIIEEEHEPIEV